MKREPKYVSREYDWGRSATKVVNVVAETNRTWMVETEGWQGRVIVLKSGRGEVKPWSKEPR